MKCQNCSTKNPENAKFCMNCGQAFTLTCPNCGTALPSAAKFCFNCGHHLDAAQDQEGKAEEGTSLLERFLPSALAAKLESARRNQAMVGERRIVTILFCDVKGSTAASEALDPEEWAEIMNGIFETMIRPVYEYEGTIVRLMGDAILAFFGAPITHEDDPRRAVLAGLEIQNRIQDTREEVHRKWGVDFDLRVGINTGLVVVGAMGSDLRMEYTAMGDAINLAARMEATAQAGTVQIAENTYRQVAPFFEVKDLGGIEVKGKLAPVQAFQVLALKAAPGQLRGIEGLEAPLIGRVDEFNLLVSASADLKRGVGGIISLVGEAGLGKSRLIQELHKQILSQQAHPQNEDGPIQWYQTACLSYESTQPYGLFKHLIRHVINARPADNPEVIREKIERLVENTSAIESPEGEPLVDLSSNVENSMMRRVLESLFGLESEAGDPPLKGETFQGQLYTTMVALWNRLATQKPVMLVMDDVHWADPASVDLVMRLFSLTDKVPLLLVCCQRADRQVPGWKIMHTAETDFPHRTKIITLDPLNPMDSGVLVDSLLQVSKFPGNLRENILLKTEGNPFFVEEVVRSLIELGAIKWQESDQRWVVTGDRDQVDIPDNVQTLLTARIDRLEEETKRILQVAAVIGRSFSYRVLAHLFETDIDLEAQLLVLQQTQLIQEISRLPELEYTFQHALVQDAAYGMILHQKKREYHKVVAEALEEIYPQQIQENAPLLAQHYDKAGEYSRALQYFYLAGDADYRLYAAREAIEHYGRALEILQQDDTSFEIAQWGTHADLYKHLYLRYGRALELIQKFNEADTNYETMETLAVRQEEDSLLLASLVARITLYAIPGPLINAEKGYEFSRHALALAENLGDKPAEAKIYWNLLLINFYTGSYHEAIDYGERSIEISREMGLGEQLAYGLNDIARAYIGTGELERAKKMSDEARVLWLELGDLPMLADNLLVPAMASLASGDFDTSLALYQEVLQIAQSIDNQWNIAFSKYGVGMVNLETGNMGSVLDSLTEAGQIADRIGMGMVSAGSRAHKAYVYAQLGDPERARELAESAYELVHADIFPPKFNPWPLAVLARVWLMLGELETAEKILEEAKIHYNPMDFMIIYLNEVPIADGELVLARGYPRRAADLMDELVELLREKGVRAMLPDALLIKAQAVKAQGLTDQAAAILQEARVESDGLGAKMSLWKITAGLAKIEEERGDLASSAVFRQEVREVLTEIADRIDDEMLRASFTAQPDVSIILQGNQ
jgi:class 3 adenylate cyclase/tetratricopeptide (TPR) repeat protein